MPFCGFMSHDLYTSPQNIQRPYYVCTRGADACVIRLAVFPCLRALTVAFLLFSVVIQCFFSLRPFCAAAAKMGPTTRTLFPEPLNTVLFTLLKGRHDLHSGVAPDS